MSSSAPVASLRDLYSAPSAPWTFDATPLGPGSAPAPAPVPVPARVAPAPSYVFSPARSSNSVFELSPSLMDPAAGAGVDLALLAKTVVASAVLQYATTAIAMPWEVGKMLLQVQWVPRQALQDEEDEEEEEEEGRDDELSDELGEDMYFADPSSRAWAAEVRPADERGYIVRPGSGHVLAVGRSAGVWATMKAVGGFRSEGWLALFKGLFTSCVADVLSAALQPMLLDALASVFAVSAASSSSSAAALALPVASHVITGVLLSPLDLVRTRLIVQSSDARLRAYSGPIDAVRTIYATEGGLPGLFLHPHLLYPTLLDSALRPLLALALPPLLAARFFPAALATPDAHPFSAAAIDALSASIGFLLTLPFETVRRRLQVQTRYGAPPINSCVQTRPTPYTGIVDALYRILTEERSDLPLRTPSRSRRRRPTDKGKRRAGGGDSSSARDAEEEGEEDVPESRWRHTGLGQLYRGLGLRLAASAIVFVMSLTMSDRDADIGWAEL